MNAHYFIRLRGRSRVALIMISAEASPHYKFLKGFISAIDDTGRLALKKDYIAYRTVHVQDHPVECFENLIIDVKQNGLKDWRLVVAKLVGNSYVILDGAHRYTLYREYGGTPPFIDVLEVSVLDRIRLLFEYYLLLFSKRFFDVQNKFLRDW